MECSNVKSQVVKVNSSRDELCASLENCLCCKYPTPIKVEKLLPLLKLYNDKKAAKILGEGFSFGFKLGFQGDRCARDSPNLKSVQNDPATAKVKLMKEVNLKRLAGPFHQRPMKNLIISPIGLIPKSEPGKVRLIQHLSFPHHLHSPHL